MKQIFVLLISVLLGTNSFAQSFKSVTVIEQRNHYLNGGGRATFFGGQSRVVIKVDLPPNTKRWYYSFSTTPDANGTKLLNLGIQVTAAISTGGASALAASAISVPPGSGSADVFVLSTQYRDAFMNKDDANWRFYGDVSVEKSKQAVQSVESTYGNSFYLGLRNPSGVDGINILIEVVAIVEEINAESDKGMLYGNLGWKAFERGELDKCVELSTKALTYNPNLAFCKFNIALVHLAQEKDEAIDDYVNAVSAIKTDTNPKYTLNGALQDVKDLELKNPNLKNLNDVKEILASELNKY